MRPQWHSIQEDLLPLHKRRTGSSSTTETGDTLPPIPLAQMWQDDEFWMPHMFGRRYFVGRADFRKDNSNNEAMCKWWFGAAPEADAQN